VAVGAYSVVVVKRRKWDQVGEVRENAFNKASLISMVGVRVDA